MKTLTRRDFLKLGALTSATAAAGIMLAGCAGGGDEGTTGGDTTGTTGGSTTGGSTTEGAAINEEYAVTDYPEITAGLLTDVSQPIDDATKKQLIADHTDADGNTFVTVGLIDDPGSLCAYGTGASKPRTMLLPLVYGRLFYRETNAAGLKKGIATSYEYIGDHIWEVKLDPNATDSEGNPIKASDVKFSMWDVAVTKYNTNNVKTYCTEIKVIDDETVHFVLTLEGPATFENRIATNYVFSQKSYEASADGMITTPVSSAPYDVIDWMTGSEIVLLKNENYWNTNPDTILLHTNVDKIILKVIKDSAQRVIALETGEIDFLSSIDETDVPAFQKDGYFTTFTYAGQRQTLYFNCHPDCPLGDVRLRQAVCYGINNEDIMIVTSGSGRLCYSVAPYTAGNYHTKWENEDYYNYDPEKAKALMKEAGVKEGELNIVIMTENYPELNQRIATTMQAQLLEIGINCEIKPVDGALFSEYKYDKTSSDIIIAATGGAGDNVVPSYASNDYKTTSETSGLTHIENAEWMELQNKALEGEYDNEYIDQCHNWIKDNVYGYALFHAALYCVTTSIVTGYTLLTQSYDCPNALTYIWNE